MIHTVSRDLALAGLSGQSSGGGGNKSTSNSAIKTLIRQEIEKKVDEEKLNLALSTKADSLDLKDLLTRQNKLEAYVHERLNQRGQTEHDITREMLKRDEENQRDEEDRIRRSIASQDDEINLGEEDRDQAFNS